MKINKVLYAVFTLLFLSFMIQMASSADPASFAQDALRGVQDFGTLIFGALFGVYQTDEFLFVKILLFILLFLGVRAGVKATPTLGEKNGIATIISLVVSLIAIRFLSENDIIRGILLPYQVLGVAILVGIVFVFYFYFVEKTVQGAGARKFMWFLFVLIMTILWFSQRDKLSGLTNYIYWGSLGLGIFMFFFDKHFKVYFDRQTNYAHLRHSIQLSLSTKHTEYRNALNLPGHPGEQLRKNILKEIKHLEDELHKYS